MKSLMLALLLATGLAGSAQEINIIPRPSTLEPREGSFTISSATKIVLAETGLNKSAEFLNQYLRHFYGFQLAIVSKTSAHANNIVLDMEKMDATNKGAYTLEVKADGVSIGGADPEGCFYAIQSLIQLLPLEKKASLTIPCVSIADEPRFAYRGMHLDVGRHFMPVSFVKQFIDYIAYYKMNTFHWHLTEDQGWRIEIKKYPKLTQVGGYRNGTIIGHFPGTGNDGLRDGGYYTQDEIREI
ncbi:MAG TPA: family 20 glycosylhydrolase, partial [Sediminibacterium sp.]|nr:family 20 glycosylhydrolase [Sediminibacterium sp.]